jgi:DNA mismatch repair protein MutH
MMTKVNYDKTSPESIYNYAKRLTGKTLAEVVKITENAGNARSRGNLGSLIEKYFFEHVPPNIHLPDFAEAKLELKTTGLVKDSKGNFKAKERLVLTMIQYKSLANERWESSSLLNKCRLMLILFYHYQKDKPVTDFKFPIEPMLFQMPEVDLHIIKRDWEAIRQKVLDGRAHELSEGDTFYLGACRKGSGGDEEALQEQPFSTTKAKTRAFSFKQTYLNTLISGHIEESALISSKRTVSIEDATKQKLTPYFGKTVKEIAKDTNYKSGLAKSKSLKHELLVRILSNGKSSVPELEKAAIEMKTITLNRNGKPKEHMSFPSFKFMEIVNEEWVDSSFCEKIEKKFLLVIFQIGEDGQERLFNAIYWNMPYQDRNEVRKVWEETKSRVAINAKDLPKVSENSIAHVRPKARDGNDKIPTPQGDLHVKQCFWLNRDYLLSVIEENLKPNRKA